MHPFHAERASDCNSSTRLIVSLMLLWKIAKLGRQLVNSLRSRDIFCLTICGVYFSFLSPLFFLKLSFLSIMSFSALKVICPRDIQWFNTGLILTKQEKLSTRPGRDKISLPDHFAIVKHCCLHLSCPALDCNKVKFMISIKHAL